jgi:4-oxalocrotonate tautomerase
MKVNGYIRYPRVDFRAGRTGYIPALLTLSGGACVPVIILKQKKGLSREQKRRIVKEFTDTLVSVTSVKKEMVTILIEEKELEDIGKGGKLRCDP